MSAVQCGRARRSALGRTGLVAVFAVFAMAASAAPAMAAWSTPQLVSSPTFSASSVSCATTAFCLAVGNEAAVWNGSTWTTSRPDLRTPLDQVSCPAAGTCYAAAGSQFDRYQRGRWTIGRAPADVANLSCPAVSFCAITSGSNVYTFHGSGWSALPEPSPTQPLVGLSCTSRHFCAVIDGDGRVFDWNGHAWDAGTPVSVYPGSPVALSCSRPGYCAVVGDYGVITFETAGTWGAPLDVTFGTAFWSVSCAGRDFCATASGLTDTNLGVSFGQPFAFDSGQVVDGGNGPTTNPEYAVSCVSSHFCMALDVGTNGVTGVSTGSLYTIWS